MSKSSSSTSDRLNVDRRNVLGGALAAAGAGLVASSAAAQDAPPPAAEAGKSPAGPFWPDGIRLVVTMSMMFEAAGRPPQVLPFPGGGMDREPMPGYQGGGAPPSNPTLYPDLSGETYLQYGYREGAPRLLDLFDRRKIKISSFMVGDAVEHTPDLAREVVERGHEAGAHGRVHRPQYALSEDAERADMKAGIDIIKQVTGFTPVGYNCWGLARSVNTLRIAQDLGLIYHIDDVSRDEPFIIPVNGKPFGVVPYTRHLNDIELFSFNALGLVDYERLLKDEFDVLYAEAAVRRRMMVVSTHDRVAGRPARVAELERFIAYAQSHPGVAFLRKDEIARYTLASPLSIREKVAT